MSQPGLVAEAARIAAAYDAVPYEREIGSGLDIDVVRGAAAAMGHMPSPALAPDVLDICCGAGGLLARMATRSEGRMVGIDASAGLLATARARGAAFGPRFEAIHADASTIDPAALGRFDVIYLIGALFIMPPAMQARVLAMVGACLKPGGIAVINGYTGLVGLARARVAAILRAENDPALPPDEQVSRARANLGALQQNLPPQGIATPLVKGALDYLAAVPDANLFHEGLAPCFAALEATSLQTALAPHEVWLLNRLPPVPFAAPIGSPARARALDARDLVEGGGYCTFIFARVLPGAPAASARHDRLLWSTPVRAAAPRDGLPTFADPATGAGLQARSPFAAAAMAAMADGPASWAGLRAAGRAAEPDGDPAVLDRQLDDVLDTMWRNRLATPLWR